MASKSLVEAISSYENFIENHGVDESVLDAYWDACQVAVQAERDVPYGMK